MLEFFINCIPPKSTHQSGLRIIRRKNGTQFIGKFSTSKSRRAQEDLLTLMMPYKPPSPLAGPLSLHIEWYYPYRKSESKKNTRLSLLPCDKRPDCDNLIKGAMDVLTRLGFWYDDGQVAEIHFQKAWTNKPGIFIRIDNSKSRP
ncbi:MAG: RusA family crossover junction endodeoxyribonuclease [Dehalococcoidales bacterium]|nr:RusA family crossover junction endodeoxyribonuclease [Dehalococcoidales bacterium]